MRTLEELVSNPKILLVENDRILLTAMANMLNARRYGVTGTAVDAMTGMEYFNRIRPDVAILDIDLGAGPSGIDLAANMRTKHPMIGIIFCSTIKDPRFLRIPARLTTTSFFLPKTSVTKFEVLESAIVDSIRMVRMPEIPSTNLYVNKLESDQKVEISNSDYELLELIASGHSNVEIARKRSIVVKSCENAISRLAKKLDIPAAGESNQRVLLTRKFFELSGKIDARDHRHHS
jgi:DNA-binding NarL/FixJ family response regulator